MQHRARNIALALGIFTLVTLSLGKFFDSRCPNGCIAEAASAHGGKIPLEFLDKLHFKMNGNSLVIADDDYNLDDKGISINLGDKDDDIGDDSHNPNRIKTPLQESFSAKDLKRIQIQSYVTSWKISEGKDDKVSFVFKGYLPPKEWTVSETTGRLEMTLKKKGPLEGELLLPKDFKGEIHMANVSGQIEVEKLARTEELHLANVSGDVKLRVAPTRSLEVVLVSGDTSFEPASVNKDLKVSLNTVSGNVEAQLKSGIQSLAVNSVNGNLTLKAGKTVGFDFSMEGVNASFNGLPAASERVEGIAHQGAKGSFGPDPKGHLSFKSVNGDFQLEAVE